MANCVGFEVIARPSARVLILGTLPSVESLKQKRYYAKKQNSFWKIMGELIGASPEMPYEDRLTCLMESGIALWDVCAGAKREGSLDADIECPIPNDFAAFFKAHKAIKLICFNGQPSRKLFLHYVAPEMSERILALPHKVLPSTSPAYASMRFEQKLSFWRGALEEFVAIKKPA